MRTMSAVAELLVSSSAVVAYLHAERKYPSALNALRPCSPPPATCGATSGTKARRDKKKVIA